MHSLHVYGFQVERFYMTKVSNGMKIVSQTAFQKVWWDFWLSYLPKYVVLLLGNNGFSFIIGNEARKMNYEHNFSVLKLGFHTM